MTQVGGECIPPPISSFEANTQFPSPSMDDWQHSQPLLLKEHPTLHVQWCQGSLQRLTYLGLDRSSENVPVRPGVQWHHVFLYHWGALSYLRADRVLLTFLM